MSGKKGRSGKGRSTHGGWMWLRQGKLPDDKKFIEIRLNRLRQGLIEALGGDAKISDGQLIIIDQITQYQGFLDLIHFYLKGEIDPFYIKDGKLHAQPVLSTFYLAVGNSISRNIERLGLNKEMVKDSMSYLDIVQGGGKGGK